MARDAVELPSQFMENWCYDAATLRGFARHWQTGEALPSALLGKLQASRTFLAALDLPPGEPASHRRQAHVGRTCW